MDTAQRPAALPAEPCTVDLDEHELENALEILRTFRLHKHDILGAYPSAPARREYALTEAEEWAWTQRHEIEQLVSAASDLIARLTAIKQEAFPDGQDDR